MSKPFGWYRPWLAAIFATPALSSKAKAVAAALALSERDGIVKKTLEQLAPDVSLSAKSVTRALDELQREGWLTRRRSRDFQEIALRVVRSESDTGSDPNRTQSPIGHRVRSGADSVSTVSGQQVRSESDTESAPSTNDAALPTERQNGAHARAASPSLPRVSYAGKRVDGDTVSTAIHLLDVFNEATGRSIGVTAGDGTASDALKQIVGALRKRSDVTAERWEAGVRRMAASPPSWVEGQLMIGHVFGSRGAEWTLDPTRGQVAASTGGNGHMSQAAADAKFGGMKS